MRECHICHGRGVHSRGGTDEVCRACGGVGRVGERVKSTRFPVKKVPTVLMEKAPPEPEENGYSVGWRLAREVQVLFVVRFHGSRSQGHITLKDLLDDIEICHGRGKVKVPVMVSGRRFNFDMSELMDRIELSGVLSAVELGVEGTALTAEHLDLEKAFRDGMEK